MKDAVTIEVHDAAAAQKVTAKYDDMLREAELVARFADEVGSVAWALQRTLVDPDLLASALLNPGDAAKAEFELLDAINGPRGLTALAVALELRGFGLKLAVDAYQAADDALDALVSTIEWGAGVAAVVTAPMWLVPTGTFVLADHLLNDGKARKLAERWLVENAHLTEHVAGALPGIVTGLTMPLPFVGDIPVFTLQDGAGMLGRLYRDGEGHIAGWGDGLKHDNPPPRSGEEVRTLLTGLAAVDDAPDPLVQVREVVETDAGGRRTTRWVVYLPGMSDIDAPGSNVNPTNLGAAFEAMSGKSTAYQQAIRKALVELNVEPGQPVMFVGHSLGGMVAMQSARDLTAEGYNVTHVLTAGSPVAGYDVPGSVRVLSLENTADVVPHLDSASNPVGPNRTTVTFEQQRHTIGDNHAIRSGYLNAAEVVDDDARASLEEWRRSAAGFFDPPGSSEAPKIFQVSRQ